MKINYSLRNADYVRLHNTPNLDNQAIANQLKALLTPAIAAQQKYYKQLGLRDRVLNLSLMVAAVLTLLWREVPSVQELTRLLARFGRVSLGGVPSTAPESILPLFLNRGNNHKCLKLFEKIQSPSLVLPDCSLK